MPNGKFNYIILGKFLTIKLGVIKKYEKTFFMITLNMGFNLFDVFVNKLQFIGANTDFSKLLKQNKTCFIIFSDSA